MSSPINVPVRPHDRRRDARGSQAGRSRRRALPGTVVAVTVAFVLTGCTSAATGSGGPVVTAVPVAAEDTGTPMPSTAPPSPPGPRATAAPTPVDPTETTPTDPPGTPTSPTPTPGTPGTPTTPADDPASAPDVRTVQVYWWAQDAMSAVAVPRTVTGPGIAAAAVRALIVGPSEDESDSGLGSSMPSDTLLLGLTIRNGTATVDLSREFERSGVGGSTADLAKLAQLTYTLTQFASVDLVRLHLDGEPIATFSGHGIEVGDGLRRADFTRQFPIMAGSVGTPTWDEGEFPPVPAGGQAVRVVRVAADDLLNVRRGPGADRTIMGRLRPGTRAPSTGREQPVGSSTWVELRTPAGQGWVNGTYLTRDVPADEFSEADALAVVDELGRRLRAGDDLRPVVSDHGLWIAHHEPPVVIDHDDLDDVADDPTTRRWGSNAVALDSPEIRPETFAKAIAESFVDVWDDDDNQVLVLQTFEGPNGRTAAAAIPSEFLGFPWVTLHDPGDDPQYGGLDWQQWMVSLEVADDGSMTVVGLTLDEWAP